MDEATFHDMALASPLSAIDADGVARDEDEVIRDDFVPPAPEPDELEERQVRARIRAKLLGETPAALRVGRYRLLRTLGRGGMGTVHAAYDDELQREVAIKVLRPDACGDEAARHRLIREAQAQAKLSHPHLVPVFEVGRFEDQIFLAMELVDGVTMTEWVSRRSPGVREILAQWIDVARALIVVHDAELVHRDVKPANVLVGPDGRARLVDFGLARGQASSDPERETLRSEDDETRSALDEEVTRSRAVVGSPAYMAPEVLRGEDASPRSDQYGLCVSIYECLVGHRPFGRGPNFAGHTEVPRAGLPRAVHRVLARGLAPRPADRFASTRALIRALEPIVDRRLRRRAMMGGGLLTAVATGGLLVALSAETTPDPCAGVEDELDEVWNDASRQQLHEGLRATQVPDAPEVARWMEASIDEIAASWRNTRREVCEAHAVERSLSSASSSRATACLHDQRQSLGVVLDAAATLDADQMDGLPATLVAIGTPAECLQHARVDTMVVPPPESLREEVDALRERIRHARVGALLEGARPHLPRARALRAEAEALGYAPLRAETAQLLGTMLLHAHDPEARAVLEDAANQAERSGDVATRELALRGLVTHALDVQLDADEAQRALDRDLAVLERLGDPPDRRAAALQQRALLAAKRGRYDDAIDDLHAVLEIRAELGEAYVPARMTTWHDLGSLLAGRGRTAEAEQAFTAADELAAASGLPSSMVLEGGMLRGRGELLRGMAELAAGHLAEADRWLEQAASETRAAYGDDSVPMGRVLMARSVLAHQRGRLDEVLELARAADAIFVRWLGSDHPLRIDALSAVGTVAFHRGDVPASIAAFEESLRLAESALPPSGMLVATHRSNLGEALVLAGEDQRARPLLEAALRSMEQALPPHDPLLAYPLLGLADIAHRGGELERAAVLVDRALTIRERDRSDLPELARTRWLAARIEADRGDRPRASALAEAARAVFESLGEGFVGDVEEIDAWARDRLGGD